MIVPQIGGGRQVDVLLTYLMLHESITGIECINGLGIMNYKGRICDLRKAGYTIKTVMEDNANGKGHHARYILMGVEKC